MRITRRCTLISFSSNFSQNPIMQRAKIDRSVRRALPVYDNEKGNAKKKTLFYNLTANGIVERRNKVKLTNVHVNIYVYML